MAFIDPHGSAAETLLNYIPAERVKDVLYFAPADASFPVSFNIMEDVGPDKRHLVVSGLMSVFKKIWVDAWSARMEYILQNTILALLEFPGSTLIGVNRMLSDKAYRDLVVSNVKDPGVRSFWVDEFAKYNERYMQEAGDAIKNKIGQFTANPIIRNIIGQPKSSFDLRKMMDERKIIIMNLSKGLIGESNANLLGSMLTTRIYLAAMSRADLPPEKMKLMPNFYFYVDEFQSFANATFANILSEARKYHLNLTIAHQYIEQMEEDVRNAVFGNVGTIISFRVGPFDAEVLETIFTPQFLATDIVNLGFAQVYLTLMIDGIGSPPFSATTLSPIAPQPVTYKDMVIAASRGAFARPRADVEVDIVKFHEPVIVPPKERKDRPPRTDDTPRKPFVQTPAPHVGETEGKEVRIERTEHSRPSRNDGNRRSRPQQQSQQSVEPRRVGGEQERKDRVSNEPRPQKKQPEQHLNELRSLLKKVVEEDSHTPPKVTSFTPREREIDGTQSAQGHTEQHTPVPSAEPIPMAKKKVVPPTQEKEVQVDPKQALRETLQRIETTNTDSSVSPKELERMMRLTNKDSSPL
jgi:hypothetical protein